MIGKLEVKGLKELEAAFRRIGTGLGRALELSMQAGATIVVNDAKRRVPVVTGDLMRSIHQELSSGASAPFQGEAIRILVGTDKAYARRIEYGFAGADKLGRVFHQAAQPYLRPAIDENRNKVNASVRRAVQQVIKKADTGGR